MWLAETAADTATLEVLAEHGIKFTVLSPFQAARTRKLGAGGNWKDVNGAKIDPSRAYLCRLPSGRSINLFFYDAPVSQAIAFEKLLESGEKFAGRLTSAFSDVISAVRMNSPRPVEAPRNGGVGECDSSSNRAESIAANNRSTTD